VRLAFAGRSGTHLDVTFLRNPYFLAAILFFVLGCFGTAFSWMTGLILLVIAFFCAFAGVTLGMMRNRQHGKTGPIGTIHLRELD
jgi:hypothetical protein